MTIKLVEGNTYKNAQIRLDASELECFGVRPAGFSLTREKPRLLVSGLFRMLLLLWWLVVGLFVGAVAFRPLSGGGGRFDFIFTGLPCGRLFQFADADDLLDALRLLSRNGAADTTDMTVSREGNRFMLYVPADKWLSPTALCLLDEFRI